MQGRRHLYDPATILARHLPESEPGRLEFVLGTYEAKLIFQRGKFELPTNIVAAPPGQPANSARNCSMDRVLQKGGNSILLDPFG